MHEPERRGGVSGRAGPDARNAVAIEPDIDRAREPGDSHLLRARRQGQPQDAGDDGDDQQQGKAQPGQQTADGPKQYAHPPKVPAPRADGK